LDKEVESVEFLKTRRELGKKRFIDEEQFPKEVADQRPGRRGERVRLNTAQIKRDVWR